MTIKMPSKKYPQVSVSRETYAALQRFRFEVQARSLNEAISTLIEEHRARNPDRKGVE
ncbi:hypothetical protein [Thermoplasma sp. Kam2015]|uniref:hypothetical protein n=1 Tax=Thermoplasma sp. Kam2015 TaxID=2094122 RepID=UPI0012940B4B|nr:hypothetical protein [Thermoplasma sp. Kam2015]